MKCDLMTGCYLSRHILVLWIGSLVLSLAAHANDSPLLSVESTNSSSLADPVIDAALGERLNPTEKVLALEIANESEARMRRTFIMDGKDPSLQFKKCGCIKAQFTILPQLPKALAHGVFVPGKSYDAWVRFSTNDSDPTHGNTTRDANKMMIKLTNVLGEKLNKDKTFSQDFILVNKSVNWIRDPRRYLKLMNDTNGVNLKKTIMPFSVGMNGAVTSIDTNIATITDPLQARFWSVVAYQLGLGSDRQAVKYSVKGCTPETEKIRIEITPDYLHEAINSRIQQKESCMQFLVQPRTSPQMDVENTSIEWKESLAPFYPVAILHIPRQDIETPEQNEICNTLSFTPWNSLPAHRPLGLINRLRKAVADRMKNIKPEINFLKKAKNA